MTAFSRLQWQGRTLYSRQPMCAESDPTIHFMQARIAMGRRAAQLMISSEPSANYDTQCAAKIAAATVILLLVAARIETQKNAAADGDGQSTAADQPLTPSHKDDHH